MIKFVLTTKNAGPILGLGLSEENIKRLREGDPILFSIEDLGGDWMLSRRGGSQLEPSGQVLIVFGETERDISKAMGFDLPQPKPGEERRIRFDRPGGKL